ncbi:MAG: ion transporter [Candidatus Latescibacterota bacterium]|nr:ion transporter [Candidatus Latescibacterota bacterium]
MNIRHRIYEIMERAEKGDRASRAFDTFIVALIGSNVVMVILETVDAIAESYGPFLQYFESFSVIVFTVEYVLRLWSCTTDPDYRSVVAGRVRFALSGSVLIDFVAIAPFYLHLFLNLDPSLVGAVRLLRLFRLFKMGRYIRSIRVLGSVIREKRQEMYLVMTVLVIVLIMISSLMFYVEHEAQPEAFSSIPAAMWWGMVTLTTVGYGDVYPITMIGKFFGILIAMLGIGMFALPAGILSSGFVEAIARESESSAPIESNEETVTRFVDAINRHDIETIISLTTDNHRMIVQDAAETVGDERLRDYWKEQFSSTSGYAIRVRTVMSKEDRVILAGSVIGDTQDAVPAVWVVRIENRQIAEWRFYAEVAGMDRNLSS